MYACYFRASFSAYLSRERESQVKKLVNISGGHPRPLKTCCCSLYRLPVCCFNMCGDYLRRGFMAYVSAMHTYSCMDTHIYTYAHGHTHTHTHTHTYACCSYKYSFLGLHFQKLHLVMMLLWLMALLQQCSNTL